MHVDAKAKVTHRLTKPFAGLGITVFSKVPCKFLLLFVIDNQVTCGQADGRRDCV